MGGMFSVYMEPDRVQKPDPNVLEFEKIMIKSELKGSNFGRTWLNGMLTPKTRTPLDRVFCFLSIIYIYAPTPLIFF